LSVHLTDTTQGSTQHSQCTAEPVDQESALHTYFISI